MAGSWHCFNHITQFIWDCELIHSSDWFMGQMGKTGQNLHGSNASIPAKKGLFDEGGRWTSPWFYPIRMYIQRSIIVYWMVVWMMVYFCIYWDFSQSQLTFMFIFFRGVAQPPTSISSCYYMFPSPFTYQKRGFIGHWKFSAFSWHWVSRIVP